MSELLQSEQLVSHRDRIHIIKDVITKLVEYGELNQTALISYCGLNLTKHKHFLTEMNVKGLVASIKVRDGKRTYNVYRPTQMGILFCAEILEPYEKMFPRRFAK